MALSVSTKREVTAIVLCGGRGQRLGSVDKPLLRLGEQTLLGHVIDRLRPQVDQIVLSCARLEDPYLEFGYTVVPDLKAGEGPLGGIVSALAEASGSWVLTTPADTPFLPRNLVEALVPACRREGASVAMAAGCRQNLTMLFDRARAESLRAFFESGERAVHRWLDANAVPTVEFPASGFLNVNTPADLDAARKRLGER